MEVLLLEDIPGVGKKNDLLIVGQGFALNCLLPQRRALVATPTVRRRYADLIRRRAEEKLKEQQLAASAAASLAGKSVKFARKTTKTGKLYAAISEKDIAEAAKDQLTIEFDSDAVAIADQIKAVGEFDVTVTLGGTEESLKVVVEAEG